MSSSLPHPIQRPDCPAGGTPPEDQGHVTAHVMDVNAAEFAALGANVAAQAAQLARLTARMDGLLEVAYSVGVADGTAGREASFPLPRPRLRLIPGPGG